MATLKELLKQFDIINQCRRYRVGLWQCPTFLFVIMGIIIVAAITLTYFIASIYTNPEVLIILEAGVASILFIIGHLIIQGFDSLAKFNMAMSEFISIASHQLRTPLTHLRWTIEMLLEEVKTGAKESTLQPKQLEQLEYIRNNSKRMSALVSDLLNVSRIERGSLPLRPSPFDLNPLIDDVLKDFQATAQAHNLILKKESEQNLPLVNADKEKIQEVLSNLVDNAIRYTPYRGEVLIKAKRQNREVLVLIQDQGVGIPEKEKKNVFQKFFRSQNIMKYQTEGTGLGLFIARGIIKASRGKIDFTSQENKGSTFRFSLPIASPT